MLKVLENIRRYVRLTKFSRQASNFYQFSYESQDGSLNINKQRRDTKFLIPLAYYARRAHFSAEKLRFRIEKERESRTTDFHLIDSRR